MSGSRTPHSLWQPTAGWQLKRIVATVLPVAFVGFFFADFTGKVDLSGWFTIAWLVVAAPIAIIVFIRSRRAAQSRRAGLQALATQPGWFFYPVDQRFTTRWSTSPFGSGDSRRASDVVMGSYAGLPCAAFTYRYTTGSGDSRSVIELGVTTLMLPGALPTLTVLPESLVGEIAPGIVRADIDVESETFNRRYRVRSAIPRFASDVLTPRTIEVLLSVEPFSWRIEGRDLIAWGHPTDSVDAVMARLEVLSTIARNIPQFVWKEGARMVR